MGRNIEYQPPGILFINGMPGSGKTTVARIIARNAPKGAHINGDEIHNLVVGGRLHPPEKPENEVQAQLLLRARNMALLADSFFKSGVFPILEQCISTRGYLNYLFSKIRSRPIAMVVLAPRLEVSLTRDKQRTEKNVAHLYLGNYFEMEKELLGIGLWLNTQDQTPELTAEEILQRAFLEGTIKS